MRNKSALITKTPLVSLNTEEFNWIMTRNPAYIPILNTADERSLHEIRRIFKPYTFTFAENNTVTVLAKTKKAAISEIKEKLGVKTNEILRIQVEYETYIKDLTTPKKVQA